MLNTVSFISETYGRSRADVIGAISYGGMAYATTGRFQAWFAGLPITRIDALEEYKNAGDLKLFDPFMEKGALANSQGLIAWGTSDERVNYRLSAKLSVWMELHSQVYRTRLLQK
jgi:hypothetical protein